MASRQRRAKAQAKAAAQAAAEVRRVEGLAVVNEHAAGIDIGSRSHWVCVGVGADKGADVIREFLAYTEGLQEIVAYLRHYQVTTVAMESTGVYWIPLYELLVANGFEVLLVDPSYTKQVKGRPKTDRLDCQWVYRLHSVGLLAAAFRPDEKTCQLRAYLRQRANVIRYAGQHIQHMEKALEQMNLKLTETISDITGVTGQAIIKAMVRGTRDPWKLAKYRDVRGGVGQVVQTVGARLEVAAPPLVEPAFGAAQSLADVRDGSTAEAKGDGTLACREFVVHGYLRGAAAGGCPRR